MAGRAVASAHPPAVLLSLAPQLSLPPLLQPSLLLSQPSLLLSLTTLDFTRFCLLARYLIFENGPCWSDGRAMPSPPAPARLRPDPPEAGGTTRSK